MTPAEVVAIVLQLFSGKPWSPPGNDWLSIRVERSMNFVVTGNGPNIDVNWSPPYPQITVKKFGIGISGALRAVRVEPHKITPTIDRLPDMSYTF